MQEQYIVDGNLNHDGTYLKTGDTVMLTPEQAAPLLEIARVKKAEQSTPAAPQIPAQPDGFPDHGLDNKEPSNPPVAGAAAPAAPSAENTPPASGNQPNESNNEHVPPQTQAPASPTPEQIAHDMEQLN